MTTGTRSKNMSPPSFDHYLQDGDKTPDTRGRTRTLKEQYANSLATCFAPLRQ